ncbi:MAG: ABC transporter permease subunit [Methanoregulaceae archaeon]
MAMQGSGLMTIARKEFFDHVRSRKFLLILGIFLVIAVVGIISGVADYNKSLSTYNERISVASTSPTPDTMGEKPSILSVFSSVSTYIVFLGAILGVAMGFDLVTKEKESKSLKILLSHPVYRDEVINGKALGSIAALVLALGIVLVLCLAALLVCGIIPDPSELSLIGVFGIVSFLFIFSYFAIALFMSTISEESGSALIYTLIIFIALSSLLPMLANDTVMETLTGSPPEFPRQLIDQMQTQGNTTKSVSITFDSSGNDPAWQEYSSKLNTYWEKRQALTDTISLFSPTMNYKKVSSSVTNTESGNVLFSGSGDGIGISTTSFTKAGFQSVNVQNIVADNLENILALLIFPILFFGLSYLRFMRLDVR